ncbi:hypothetical protein [Streptosporangium sp. KLBMP 9127]|nr:hypothetical protein [Streptosporangium sp. KLBMP 9127]
MKTRILAAALAIAALSGLLVASPAQARVDVVSAHVNPQRGHGGGSVRAAFDFVNRTKVVFRNFTVRDICPGDHAPVKAQIIWVYMDGTKGSSAWRSDTNGCGAHGTNFGTITHIDRKHIRKIYLSLRVYDRSGEIFAIAISDSEDNEYT